ncbi:hypothetical protein L1987_55246 [Smallanthus sonchifolius]|uniref:Uncharacterized protein n=1 Tax=Smallanthus sonchifolius TaxID=185202 RepID=A0ACB9E9C5_9ASTR|nr:hypothetical protein L1987_55246 [Smallanthus sonchifolius]
MGSRRMHWTMIAYARRQFHIKQTKYDNISFVRLNCLFICFMYYVLSLTLYLFQYFNSREDFVDWSKKRGREHGCVIVVSRSRKKDVELGCNRGGEHNCRGIVRRTESIKKSCPFKLIGRYIGKSNSWRFDVTDETHNHDPVVFEEGHAQLRKMSAGEIDLVERLHRQHVRARQVLAVIREEFPCSRCVVQDIYNATTKIRAESKIGLTPMQELENLLQSEEFVYHTRENPSTNVVEDVLFCHPTSYKMWRAFPHLMLVDTTYKTNMYDIPFVQFIGVTSISKSFCIAHTFISRERQDNFTWVLERIKDILDGCVEPCVIVTDRDVALMSSCDIVFPSATKNLCMWNIMENITRRWKGFFKVNIWKDFSYWWKVLCESPMDALYDYNCTKMEEKLNEDGKQDKIFILNVSLKIYLFIS